MPATKVARTPAADKLTADEVIGDTLVATKPVKKPRSLTKATNGIGFEAEARQGI